MDPLLSALLLSWYIRPEVLVVLALLGSMYTRGWWHIRRRRAGREALATGWQLAAYLGGLAILGVALMSPIDVLSGQLFAMHIIQHLLLVMIAPPLLLIASPLPFFLWALPARARYGAGGLLNQESPWWRALRSVTTPGLVWMGFVAVFVGWHDPKAYDAALRSNLVHNLEHIIVFGAAMLYWWQVIGAGPRLRSLSRGVRLVFLLATISVTWRQGWPCRSPGSSSIPTMQPCPGRGA